MPYMPYTYMLKVVTYGYGQPCWKTERYANILCMLVCSHIQRLFTSCSLVKCDIILNVYVDSIYWLQVMYLHCLFVRISPTCNWVGCVW